MITPRICLFVASIALLASGLRGSTAAPAGADLLGYVDPLIGTDAANTPSTRKHSEGATENKGQVVPSVSPPWAMTQWVAQTRAGEVKGVTPYYYSDGAIQGFRASHWLSGSATQDYGSMTLMPVSGALRWRVAERESPFTHESETAQPDYYAVDLPAHGVHAEMTATTRAGFLRFTYTRPEAAHLIIQPNSDHNDAEVWIDPARGEVWVRNPVYRIYQGIGKPAGISGWFVLRFSEPLRAWGTFDNTGSNPGEKNAAKRPGLGAYVTFDVPPGTTVQVKVGTSFTAIDGARRNLDAEIPGWDFAAVRKRLIAAWAERLNVVRVTGSPKNQTKFYTAMFHSLQQPRTFSDIDGAYPEFAGGARIQHTKSTYYMDFSTWDTYRALHPLYHLLYPQVGADMANSLIAMAEQGGWMPTFPMWGQYTSAMIGDHAATIIADAAAKGVPGLELARAYPYLRKNAYETPAAAEYQNGQGRRALVSYLKNGYVPVEDHVLDAFHKNEQVSRTLEYAFDDFALSRVAARLGHTADALDLAQRAGNYAHVFDPAVGFMRGRFTDGRWVDPFDPHSRQEYITEGTPNHYTWSVQHDPAGLIALMGGDAAFNAKLDAHFAGGHNWHGNEPCHHVAYLYDWSGQPWKAQRQIRHILNDEYDVGPGGLGGNDDSGQMSAWYVFSALGFYPVCPGVPQYAIGTPTFDSAELRLHEGKVLSIVVRNPGAGRIYIRAMTFNGKPYERAWLDHAEIIQGGRIEVEMTDQEGSAWGTRENARPFSLSAEK